MLLHNKTIKHFENIILEYNKEVEGHDYNLREKKILYALRAGVELLKHNKDQVWVIDGGVGDGKTDLACECFRVVSDILKIPYNIDHITTDTAVFRDLLGDDEVSMCPIIIDEAGTIMSSKRVMEREQKNLEEVMQMIRQKKLFMFMVLPNIGLLNRYVREERVTFLLHIEHRVIPTNEKVVMAFNQKRIRQLGEGGKFGYYNLKGDMKVKPNFTFRTKGVISPIYKEYVIINEQSKNEKIKKRVGRGENYEAEKKQKMPEGAVNIRQAAFSFKVSAATIHRWLKQKSLEPFNNETRVKNVSVESMQRLAKLKGVKLRW